MHGIGNDFVMVDNTAGQFGSVDLSALAVDVCDRKFGIGGDGLILAEPGQQTRFAMRMLNPDGSESEMCGNGIRCFALYLRALGLTTESEIPVETGAGTLHLSVRPDEQVTVDMGLARTTRGEIGMSGDPAGSFTEQPVHALGLEFVGTAVSMGNPHLVLFVDDANQFDLGKFGPVLEHHELFPNRVNVHFVSLTGKNHILQRTWERGAGFTLACGTGACACAFAARQKGWVGDSVTVSLPGGNLTIDISHEDAVKMTGPARFVFQGDYTFLHPREAVPALV